MIDVNKVRLATHYARLTDSSANPDLAFVAMRVPTEERHQLLVTSDEKVFIVGTDKDNYHANVLRMALIRAGETGLVSEDEHHKIALDVADAIVPSIAKRLLEADQELISRLGIAMQDLSKFEKEKKKKSKRSAAYKVVSITEQAVNLIINGDEPKDAVVYEIIPLAREVLNAAYAIEDSSSKNDGERTKVRFLSSLYNDPAKVYDWARDIKLRLGRPCHQKAPLRQTLKQIILPGPDGDLVVTSLPSLPLLRRIADLSGLDKEIGWRFIKKNRQISNLQNIGITGKFCAFRYRFPGVNRVSGAAVAWETAIAHVEPLYRAISARRVYLKKNGLSLSEARSRSDLDSAIVQRASEAAASLLDATGLEAVDIKGLLMRAMRQMHRNQPGETAKSRFFLYAAEQLLVESGIDASVGDE